MKQFPHIFTELFHKPLLITQARHAAIVRILEARIAGEKMAFDVAFDDGEMPEPDPTCEYRVVGETAIIPVHGTIVRHAADIPASSCGCPLEDTSQMIDAAMADRDVNTLIFDMRTPGGSVTGVPEMASKIANITRKNTIAFTESECCSAGVWLATQCQHFFCSPSSSVGSIGVWSAYTDISRQLQNDGVNIQTISAGKFKLLGAYWKPLTDSEKAILQADIDKIYTQFKEEVNLRRQVSDEFMQGQVFDGEQACEIGLCDGLINEISELIDD